MSRAEQSLGRGARVACGAASVLFVLLAGFALAVGIARSIVVLAPARETAELARRLSPFDPMAARALGSALLDPAGTRLPETGAAIDVLEEAARLSPYSYEVWMTLGRAYERAGRGEDALDAFHRAIALAPRFAEPHWVAANALLRTGRTEEAAEAFRHALALDPTRTRGALSTLWIGTEGDAAMVRRAVPEDGDALASYAAFLVERKRFDDVAPVWAEVVDSSRSPRDLEARATSLSHLLVDNGRYDLAAVVLRDVVPDAVPPAGGGLLDGGFERGTAQDSPSPFPWRATPARAANVTFDKATFVEGAQSLRVDYDAPGNPDFVHVEGIALVTPGRRYALEAHWRTQSLSSMSPPVLVVADARGQRLASVQVGAGTSDWTRSRVEFVGSDGGAIRIVFSRARCSVDTDCPIFGTVWLDGLELAEVGREK